MAIPKLSQGTALAACGAMAMLYVGILYVPQLLLRLPPARTINEHYIRRFVSSAIASGLASWGCFLLLPVEGQLSYNKPSLLTIFGLRTDHLWQATTYPLLLTALLYLGPLVMASLDFVSTTDFDALDFQGLRGTGFVQSLFTKFAAGTWSLVFDIFAWRNFVVGPVTEEWVFRACMIPLLLCAGYSPTKVMLFCPLFFGLVTRKHSRQHESNLKLLLDAICLIPYRLLGFQIVQDGVGLAAHLNHYWEVVYPEKKDHQKAAFIVGFRFAYTTIFGWYAAYLFLRTGHLVAPIVAHVLCNVMGLPALGGVFSSSHTKVLGFVFLVGLGGFIYLLQPVTSPLLYNNIVPPSDCNCCFGHCKWRG